MLNPKRERLHLMLLPCYCGRCCMTDDRSPEGMTNTRGITIGTCLTIWPTLATQPRLAYRACHHDFSSGRPQQSAPSLALQVEKIRQGSILGQSNLNYNTFSHSQHSRGCGPGET